MPSYLDLALIIVVLVSALLSMLRGFTREVLAIGSWGAAALAAYSLYPLGVPYLKPYIPKESFLPFISAAIIFFVTLLIVSIITVKISDAILDSKVGALDRSLGFLFGAARGLLLCVVAFIFFSWLVPPDKQPAWVANAKTRPVLENTGAWLREMLPEDLLKDVSERLKPGKPGGDGAPAGTPAPRAPAGN